MNSGSDATRSSVNSGLTKEGEGPDWNASVWRSIVRFFGVGNPKGSIVAELKRTPFYDFHVKAGARMVDFAGWEMPLLYKGIIEEHHHTRTAASIFDVSHMGRLRFTGKGAEAFLQKVCTDSGASLICTKFAQPLFLHTICTRFSSRRFPKMHI